MTISPGVVTPVVTSATTVDVSVVYQDNTRVLNDDDIVWYHDYNNHTKGTPPNDSALQTSPSHTQGTIDFGSFIPGRYADSIGQARSRVHHYDQNSYRQEYQAQSPYIFVKGTHNWAGISFYLPSDQNTTLDNDSPNSLMLQSKQAGENAGHSPLFALRHNGMRRWMVNTSYYVDASTVVTQYHDYRDIVASDYDRWIDVVFHWLEDDVNGELDFWIDGDKFVEYRGPLYDYLFSSGLTARAGLYYGTFRDNAPIDGRANTAYYDTHRVASGGSASYESVAPSPCEKITVELFEDEVSVGTVELPPTGRLATFTVAATGGKAYTARAKATLLTVDSEWSAQGSSTSNVAFVTGATLAAKTSNVVFVTYTPAAPIPPTYGPKTSYNGLAVNWDAKAGWQNLTGSETWSATGLPTGLSMAPSTGIVTGTPSANGGYTVTVTANDGTAYPVDPFTWTIRDALPAPEGGAGAMNINLNLMI